jgi:hypothetical protein
VRWNKELTNVTGGGGEVMGGNEAPSATAVTMTKKP